MSRVLDDLRDRVRAAQPGDRLPSVRELTAQHRVSPVTVQRAVAQLAAEGLVVPRPGHGTFVSERRDGAAAHTEADLGWQSVALEDRVLDPVSLDQLLAVPGDEAITLSTGFVDASLQPLGLLGRAAARAARSAATWGRRPVEGDPELRAWFARDISDALTAHDIAITSGGQAALATTMRALGRPGSPVLVESPTYLGALAAARAAGLRPVPVPADQHGVRPDLLADALLRTRARLVVLQPRHANPTGASLAGDRRADVLTAVQDAGAFLIEDDPFRDLTFEGAAVAPLVGDDPHGHVVHIRSLTKSAAPGLRVGAVAARGPAGARLRAARVIDDFFVSGLLQRTTLELLAAPGWPRHRSLVNAELRARRDALIGAARDALPNWTLTLIPKGGLNVWFRLPDGTDDVALTQAAAAAGVVVFPGRPWFAAEPPAPFLRLTYAGATVPQLREGVSRLARSIAG